MYRMYPILIQCMQSFEVSTLLPPIHKIHFEKKRSQANRIHLYKENTLNVFCQDEFRLQRDLLLCHFGEELVFEYIKS